MLFEKKARCLWICDEYHNLWTSVGNACKDSGFSVVIKLVELVMNLNYGPWAGQKFYHEILEMSRRYLEAVDDDDPLMVNLAEKVRRDMGSDHDFSEGFVSRIIDELAGARFLQIKGPHVSQTRWFDWMKGFRFWSTWWTLRHIVLLFIGINLGWLTRHQGTVMIEALKGVRPAEGRPQTTAQAKMDASQLRDRCKNSLHVCAVVTGDEGILQHARMVLHLTDSSHEWYSEWAHRLRSRGEALTFSIGLALGTITIPTLIKVMRFWQSYDLMHECGLVTQGLSQMKGVSEEFLLEQDRIAENASRLAWNIITYRIGSLVQSMFMFPKAFAGLLSSSPDHVSWVLHEAKAAHETFQQWSTSTLPWCRQTVRESYMQWTLTKDIMQELSKVDFRKVPDELHAKLKKLFSGFGCTLLSEISFQRDRRCEHERPDKHVTSVKAWHTVVEQQVLSATFNFREVSLDSVAEPNSKGKASLPDSMFRPVHGRQTVDLKAMVSVGKAKFPSFTPESARSMAENLQAARYHIGDLAACSGCWRSQFLYRGCLVWKQKPVKESKLYFSMGAYSTAALLWPAEVFKVGSNRLWGLAEIASAAELRWAAVSKLDEWALLPAVPISPATLWSSNGKQLPHSPPPTLLRQSEKRPIGLLKYGAQNAFFRMRADILDKLAKDELDLSFEQGTYFPQRLLTIVMKILECPQEEALKILESRTFKVDLVSGAESVLESDELQGCLTQAAAKEMNTLLQQLETSKAQEAMFKELLVEKRGAGRKRRAVKFVGDGERAMVPSSFTEFLPLPTSRLYRDTFNGRWIVWYDRHSKWSSSKSWGSGREWPCVLAVLQAVWDHHTDITGEKCHIIGLMPVP